MNTNFRILSFILFSLAFSVNIWAGAVPNSLVQAFRSGNSREVARYFNTSIELVIAGKEGIYSKNQAEQILQKFFGTHTPTSFSIIHEGEKSSPKYAIGSLKTTKGEFRVYFLIKFVDDKPYIQQLRIEPE